MPANSQELSQHRELARKIQTLKLHYEREAFRKLLQTFHSNADLEHMILQLKEEISPTRFMFTPVKFALPERDWLANHLFVPADDQAFARSCEYAG